jgi:hypothetical protein
MKESFKKMLKEYRKSSFKLYHEHKDVKGELLGTAQKLTKEILSQRFKYTFHKKPNSERAEIFNMIYNFTTEALLPPILEKVLERTIIVEKRHEMLLGIVEKILEILSEEKKL